MRQVARIQTTTKHRIHEYERERGREGKSRRMQCLPWFNYTAPGATGVCDDDELQSQRKQKRRGVLVQRAKRRYYSLSLRFGLDSSHQVLQVYRPLASQGTMKRGDIMGVIVDIVNITITTTLLIQCQNCLMSVTITIVVVLVTLLVVVIDMLIRIGEVVVDLGVIDLRDLNILVII